MDEPGEPKYRARFLSWNLSPELADELFVFEAPEGAVEADAQERRRGSVRHARPDGTYNRSTRGGGSVSSTGASRETSREVEFDDGRVESVERESAATGRFGESVEREREIEREGYGVASFEGEASTSTRREAEIEGAAARGYYGRRGVVADVDTKYRGEPGLPDLSNVSRTPDKRRNSTVVRMPTCC